MEAPIQFGSCNDEDQFLVLFWTLGNLSSLSSRSPSFVQYELADLDNFNADTRDMYQDLDNDTPLRDVTIDRQTDDLVDMTANR